jgi:hypothetical protein
MKKVGFIISLLSICFNSRAQHVKVLLTQEKVYGRVNTITEIQLTPKSDGTATDSLVIKRKYDNKGNTIKEIFTTINHYSPNENVFDKDGNRFKGRRRMNISVFNYNTFYKNDGERKIICKDYAMKKIYLFDKNGTLTRSDEYQTNGQLTSRGIYKYDDKHRLIEINFYTDKDSLYEQDIYKFNDKNLVTERSTFWDENNLQKHLLQAQYIYNYVSFDRFGNWIKRNQKEIESGNRAESVTDKIVIRKITYY